MNSGRTVLNQSSTESVPDLEHLVERFIASTLPREEWTHLVHLTVERSAAHMSLPERVSNLLTSKLAQKDALLTFYSRTTLMSEKARAEWVEPDIAPIRLGRQDAVAVDNVATTRQAES